MPFTLSLLPAIYADSGLFRRAGNIAGMAFPLFTQQMFANVGYRWANSIFGFIGIAMIPIPFVSHCLPSPPSIPFTLLSCPLKSKRANADIDTLLFMYDVQVLFFYGPSIRRKSKFSRMVLDGRSAA
jgi:hypothetical protein